MSSLFHVLMKHTFMSVTIFLEKKKILVGHFQENLIKIFARSVLLSFPGMNLNPLSANPTIL